MGIRKIQKHFVNKPNKSGGFTLIELVVAMIIIGVISSLFLIYIMSSTKAFNRVQSRKSLIIDAASCMKLFSRETSITDTIITATSKNIRFKSNIYTNVIIDYEINNDGTFTRIKGDGEQALLSRDINFEDSYINYYDVNDIEVDDGITTNIRRIRLSLLLNRNNESTRFTADIFPETFRH